MWPDRLVLCGLLLALLLQAVLLADLLSGATLLAADSQWLVLYSAAGLGMTFCSHRLLRLSAAERSFSLLLLLFSLLIPVVGLPGCVLALVQARRQARRTFREPEYWSVTRSADLPFTPPTGRQLTLLDSRGFAEQLMYSTDSEDLYRKVLAISNIRVSLSVSALKEAMRHSDERIRLTAFKTLDRLVTQLNLEIQKLEACVQRGDPSERANAWMQIASNCWELLVLEEGEPVAREQLLQKASHAAIQAVLATPSNPNAHFLLGRVCLLQGNLQMAKKAFEQSRSLGMPADKVVPYLAETAFKRHDFGSVRELLNSLEPAVKAYPPLCQVAGFWS